MRDVTLSLTPDEADVVRAIVDDECGPGYWDGFNRYMGEPDRWGKEWRFGGLLGFGGKVHYNGQRVRVSCYPEDEVRDPKRSAMIVNTNARLGALDLGSDHG